MATARRLVLLQSSESADSNFADWAVASSSATHSSAAAAFGDLSLGFNAAPNSAAAAVDGGSAAAAAGHVGVWSSSSARQMQINHGLTPDMGMFVVAPAASFLHHHHSFNGQHQHFHHQNQPTCIGFDGSNPSATALGVGVGVIPLLADDLLMSSSNRGRGSGGLQLWENQDVAPATAGHNSSSNSAANINYTKKPSTMAEHTHGSPSNNSPNLFQLQGGAAGGVATSSSTGAATCQDCGNQAKKDCIHRRCRTCCKSRGLDCATHVKSTWVPAARRRERQQASHSTNPAAVTASCSQSVSSGAKKPRLVLGNNSQTSHTSTSNNTTATATTPRSFDTGDSGGGSMPKQLTAPAEFRCVRVSPMDGGEDDEFAYQAVVRIGGHVFKGFLYDQGLDNDSDDHAENNVPHPGLFPNISDLHLGARGGSNNVILGSGQGTSSSPPILAPSSDPHHDIYGAVSGGGGMIGMGGSSNFGIGNPF